MCVCDNENERKREKKQILTRERIGMSRRNIKINQRETKRTKVCKKRARFSSVYLNLREATVEANIPIKAKPLQPYRDPAAGTHGCGCAQTSERQTESQIFFYKSFQSLYKFEEETIIAFKNFQK